MSFKEIDSTKNDASLFPGKILLYGFEDTIEKEFFESFLKKYTTKEIFFIPNNLIFEKVGFLAGVSGFETNSTSISTDKNLPDFKFMMLSGFSEQELYSLITSFKSENVKRPITATMTETNQDWVFADLLEEVYTEHQMMTARNKN